MNVLFIEPILAHYRRDTYKILMSDSRINISLIAGDQFENIKSVNCEKLFQSSYIQFSILNHRFYYLKGFFKTAKRLNPEIIVCSGIDFHLIHTILFYLYVKLFTPIKFIWWSHGTSGKQGKIGCWIRSFIYKNSDGIFSYSDFGKQNLIKMGVPDCRIVSVGNAINTDDYGFNKNIIKEIEDNERNFTILFTGRLTHAKRIDILLHSLKILKDKNTFKFKCVIVGGGIVEELQSLSNKLGITEIVDFVGPKYDDEIVPYFINSDLYVFPGGIGLSIVHALSYGLPVVTTNNIKAHFPEFELLKPTINGDIYLDGNPDDLANKIELWRLKLSVKKSIIAEDCISSIREKGYLPELQAKKILEFLII